MLSSLRENLAKIWLFVVDVYNEIKATLTVKKLAIIILGLIAMIGFFINRSFAIAFMMLIKMLYMVTVLVKGLEKL